MTGPGPAKGPASGLASGPPQREGGATAAADAGSGRTAAPTAVSVVVVSQGRPDLLCRCITGLKTLFHRPFEVIVVADAAGLRALAARDLLQGTKHREFDRPNISAARNIGIALSAGRVIAFIDDDAVPEPTWLERLVAPFADRAVAAAGGFVLGRNGISWQWRARRVDGTGQARDVTVPEDRTTLHAATPGDAVKLEGTNCAFRADVLRAMGGFDEAIHFYLDETDLCYRLAQAGHTVAIVPGAVVHHGFAASARRTADRVPRTLFDIGASAAVYLQRHNAGRTLAALARLRAEQRSRLDALAAAGRIPPAERYRLLETLERGIAEGMKRPAALATFPDEAPQLLPFAAYGDPARSRVISGRGWRRDSLLKKAEQLSRNGVLVTVMVLSPTSSFHSVHFDPRGFWLQKGGIFGKSTRGMPLFRLIGFSARVREEARRQSIWRPMGEKG